MKTAIKNLNIQENKNYKLSISEILKTSIKISLEGKEYLISIPKNKTWIAVKMYENMQCIVQKVHYGKDNQYIRLDLIEILPKDTKEKKMINTIQKRIFKLPSVESLNKDQDRILRLPEAGQFLIIGGPGTGKSVVALLRAMKYHKNNNYAFLTFNKVLLSATKQLVDFKLTSFTLDSWIGKAYWKVFQSYLPTIHKGNRKIDYAKIIEKLEEAGIQTNNTHLIIDEGQDKPRSYYETLIYLGIENFFIVADSNQQITEENTSRETLTELLALEDDEVIELKENYRNSHPIALFAQHFFTDPSSPIPTLPSKFKSFLGTPIHYKYTHYEACVKIILREADRDNRNLIAVVVATEELREVYVEALHSIEIKLDNPRPIISSYSFKEKKVPDIKFDYSGIVVLNDKSVKGLEFDIVYVIIDGFKVYQNNEDSMKKRFYVMSSRAIKKLVFFQSQSYVGGVEKLLPQDENILKRERLNHA
jgi:hypothetical protein